MPWSTTQVWRDEEDGPEAFSSVAMFNQRIWDSNGTNRAICEALSTGGFDADCIHRQVGNYEGQIIAIRRGLVAKEKFGYRITASGRQFLKDNGRRPPDFLWAEDDWHHRKFEFCLWEVEREGEPFLKFAEKMFPRISVGMNPLFSRDEATALRDYLSAWIERTNKSAPTDST